jgi:hypothetical protein
MFGEILLKETIIYSIFNKQYISNTWCMQATAEPSSIYLNDSRKNDGQMLHQEEKQCFSNI